MEELAAPNRNRLYILLAWLATLPLLLVVFYPALQAPFLLDDQVGIVNNSEFRSFSVHNLVMLFRGHADTRAYDHHAVPGFVSMVDHAWSGVDPFGYHLTNLFIHWANCGLILLFFVTVWKTIEKNLTLQGVLMGISLMTIWAVHPFSTMPVAYVTCRTESLMVFFYVLALLAFLRGWEWISIPLGVASILSKEVAVTLPGAILMVDWARSGVGIIPTLLQRMRYYIVLTSVWLLMIAYHLRGSRRTQIGAAGMPLAHPWEYFKTECGIIGDYFRKLFWPTKLQFYPFYRPVAQWQEWVPQLIGIVLYLCLAVYLLRKSRWLGIVLLFPLLVLLPTSTFIPIPYEPAMEYRMYLPGASFLALLVIGIWRWVRPTWARIALIAVVAIPLAVVSHLRTRDYETSLKLHEQQLTVDPQSLTALEAVTGSLFTAGMYDRATVTAWKLVDYALADKDKEFAGRGFNALGTIEASRRNYREARDFFQRAIEFADNNSARLSLASMQVELMELPEAEKLLRGILARTPDHPEATLLLYEAKMSAKDYDEGEKILDHFLTLYPERSAELEVQKTRVLHLKRKRAEGAAPLVRSQE
ncbi:tetratricopeptide repeat protein [Bryobacter aggregatus]|uniref:tetratricopeptide repeat protein n=1 Tax=Bryobacter aggregatus TaxID=360054 RepID=UPI0004E2358E|nr:tetratricopeptide repeat protein [Bryobacter aggregatus]